MKTEKDMIDIIEAAVTLMGEAGMTRQECLQSLMTQTLFVMAQTKDPKRQAERFAAHLIAEADTTEGFEIKAGITLQ